MKKDKAKKKHEKEIVPMPEGLTPEASAAYLGDKSLEELFKMCGGKWKMRILWALQEGDHRRYSAIKSEVPPITDMMLSQSLKELIASGLVTRRQFQEIPPRVEYQITPNGATIVPVLKQLVGWVQEFKG